VSVDAMPHIKKFLVEKASERAEIFNAKLEEFKTREATPAEFEEMQYRNDELEDIKKCLEKMKEVK